MICSIKNPAERRYVIRMWIAAGLCVLLAVVAALTFRLIHPTGPVAYLVAVLPGLPILAALVYTGVYLAEEKDEFQRNLLVQSLLGGIGGTLALTTVWGYLEDFAKTPRLDLIWVYAIFWAFAAVSYFVVRARYR
jgi:hypothetical protein